MDRRWSSVPAVRCFRYLLRGCSRQLQDAAAAYVTQQGNSQQPGSATDAYLRLDGHDIDIALAALTGSDSRTP